MTKTELLDSIFPIVNHEDYSIWHTSPSGTRFCQIGIYLQEDTTRIVDYVYNTLAISPVQHSLIVSGDPAAKMEFNASLAKAKEEICGKILTRFPSLAAISVAMPAQNEGGTTH